MANNSIRAAFERMWQHITLALSNKADKSEVSNVVIETVALQQSNIIANTSKSYFILADNKTIDDIFMLTFTDSRGISFTAVKSESDGTMNLTGMGCKVETTPVFMYASGNMLLNFWNADTSQGKEPRILLAISKSTFIQNNNSITMVPSLTVSNVTVYYK